MGLNKLGKFIEISDLRNSCDLLGENFVVGLSTQKEMIRTKADLDGVKLSSYKLFPPNHLAYVPDTSRRGDKISLAYNDTENTYLVSSISIVFYVKDMENLLPDFLFMYFNRPEFDRYSRFNSWGSARETFSWEDMCDMEIDLPPIEIQQKYVNIHKAMQANQKSYEKGLEDLKLMSRIYIERLKDNTPIECIGKYLHEENERNFNYRLTNVLGVNKDKQFIPTVANLVGVSLDNYKVVKQGQFAYSNRINIGSIALRKGEPCLVSPSYIVFSVDTKKVLPEYLLLWMMRDEFCHFAFFYSLGTIKDDLTLASLGELKIPIPDIKVQQSIANIYSVYIRRKEINQKLKEQLKAVCPVLVKGAMDEGRKEATGR